MGYLFENMEEMDIQAERRNTVEERKKAEEFRKEARAFRKDAEEAKKDAEEARREAEEIRKDAQRAMENIIKSFILECQKSGRTREDAADHLAQVCSLPKKDAEEKLNRYWKG